MDDAATLRLHTHHPCLRRQAVRMTPRSMLALAVGLARPVASRETIAWRHVPAYAAMRTYATHTDRPSSFASSSSSTGSSSASLSSQDARTAELFSRLESEAQRRAARKAMGGGERVGPFPLGVGPSGRNKTWRKWSELGIGGKVMRTTRQTGNLTVILIGGGLFVVLAFALTTELFAKNSPSVLYSQAVDMIRDSNALDLHLLPPLTFTHTPHAASPVRGSPALPHTFVRNPKTGREHMLLTFWVHGRSKDDPEPLGWGPIGWARGAWNVLGDWAEEWGVWAGVLGDKQPSTAVAVQQSSTATTAKPAEAVPPSGGNSWLGGLFGGVTGTMRGGGGAGKDARKALPPPGTYTVGEVRADYVKSASGQYTLLSLVIDVPGSSAPQPNRAVVFWSPEANTEGLAVRTR